MLFGLHGEVSANEEAIAMLPSTESFVQRDKAPAHCSTSVAEKKAYFLGLKLDSSRSTWWRNSHGCWCHKTLTLNGADSLCWSWEESVAHLLSDRDPGLQSAATQLIYTAVKSCTIVWQWRQSVTLHDPTFWYVDNTTLCCVVPCSV